MDLFRVLAASLAAILCVFGLTPAWPQVTAEDWQVMNEIISAHDSINDDNAREAYDTCVAIGKKLDSRDKTGSLQKLALEAEVASCISFAMLRGKFSDQGGDHCRYRLASAEKFAQLIEDSNGKPGYQGEIMSNLADRLQQAGDLAPDMGCSDDYGRFRQAIELARAAAAQSQPEHDLALLDEISAAISQLSAENAKQTQSDCSDVLEKIGKKPGRPEAERLYLEANVANCVSMAMERGGYSDATGDACSHLHDYANRLVQAEAASQNDFLYASFGEMFRSEADAAIEHAAKLGCSQDFQSLR